MAYRKFDTGTWQDPWFENLSAKAKLAFIYLWTSEVCTPAGVYEISRKRVRFELGYDLDDVYPELQEKVFWLKEYNLIWVKNFFRRQCQNHKFVITALNSIKEDPRALKIFIEHNRKLILSFKNKEGKSIIDLSGYHIDTISIPYPEQKTEQDTISIPYKNKESDTISIPYPEQKIPYPTEQNRTEQKQNRTEIKKPQILAPSENPAASPKSSTAPSGFSFKNFRKNKSVVNKHGDADVGEYFRSINKACNCIDSLPKKQKKFSPHKWSQVSINGRAHPGAVQETLEGLHLFWDTADDPWAVCNSILATKNGNWNEKEAIAIHQELKSMKPSQLEFFTQGLFQEMPQ